MAFLRSAVLVLWAFLDNPASALPVGASAIVNTSPSYFPILHGFGLPELFLSSDSLRQHLKISRDDHIRDDVPTVPGVDAIKVKIQEWGIAEALPDLFYTQYPVSAAEARRWGKENFDEAEAAKKKVSDDYQGYMEHNGFTQARMDYYSDYFQKNMAQAFGEEAHGDVYLLVDDDVYPNNDWNTASTWGGWEYPALTRNDKVDNIYRVDPSASIGCASIIWSRGDGASTHDPKGVRGVTTPTIA